MRATLLLLVALLPACRSAALAPLPVGSLLLVLSKSGDTLEVYSARSGERVDSYRVGSGPHEVAVSGDGRSCAVANYGAQVPGNTITVIDLYERRYERVVDLGEHTRPHGIEYVDGDHWLVVTSETSRALLEVSARTGDVRRVLETQQELSHMLVLSPDRGRAYVANIGSGSLSVLDLESGLLLAVVPTGPGAEGLDVSPDGREVWVANRAVDTLSVVDAQTLAVVAEIDVSPDGAGPPDPARPERARGFPIRLKFTPDGGRVLVSNALAGEVAVLDARTRSVVARVPVADAGEDGAAPAAQGQGPTPVGLLVEPRGRFAFVACTNADQVVVLDLERLALQGRIDTGPEPDGMAWTHFTPAFYGPPDESHPRIGIGIGVGIGGGAR